MPFGLLTGLGAALSWGTLDYRRPRQPAVGSLRVTAGMQSSARPARSVVLVTGRSCRPTRGDRARSLLGLIGAGAYLALLHGPAGSARSRSSAASSPRTAGSPSCSRSSSAARASPAPGRRRDARHGRRRPDRRRVRRWLRRGHLAGPGVVFAIVALVLFAVMAITMDVALEAADWIQVLVVSRLVIALVSILAIVGIARSRRAGLPG